MAPIAAAFLPHPPLLVPGLAGTAAPELDPLRAACREALITVTATADLTILVGTGPVWAVPTPSALGSFHPYGADLDGTLPALTDLDLPAALTDLQLPALTDNHLPGLQLPALTDDDLPGLPPPVHLAELPLSLAVAAHLLATLDPPPIRLAAVTVPAALGPSAAAAIGHALAAAGQRAVSADSGPASGAREGEARGSPDLARPAGRIGLVVMGDLSACRTDRAPGGFRPEAAAFDASISEAFRSATPHRLLDLDPIQATSLLVSGRVPLQVLAGAFEQLDLTGKAQGGQGEPGRGGIVAKAPSETGPDAGPGETGSSAVLGDAGSGGILGDARSGGTLNLTRSGGILGQTGSGGIPDQPRPELRGRVLYEEAPYGVGYLVAILTAP
jgi:hypothetical protein